MRIINIGDINKLNKYIFPKEKSSEKEVTGNKPIQPMVTYTNAHYRDFAVQKLHFGTTFSKEVMTLKKLHGIPCLYCGKAMIPRETYDSLLKLNNSNTDGTKTVIHLVKKYKKLLPPVEKAVFEEIEKMHQQNPSMTLKSIFIALRPKYIEALSSQQIVVLNQINQASNILPKEKREILLTITKKAETAIINDDTKNHFKNEEFCKELGNFLNTLSDKRMLKKIARKAAKMPSSKNNANAFIVKFSNFALTDEPENVFAQNLGQKLLARLVVSVEHLKPQNKWGKGENGKNELTNIALAHSHCNGKRSSIRLSLFVKEHPEVHKSAQKQVDYIIDLINESKVKHCERYPQILRKSLRRESKGLINIDISRLKTPQTSTS